jgi:hypothetical protein
MLNSNGFLVICDGSFSSRINRFLVVADQSIYYPEGVLEEAIIHVGQSYVPMDFVIVETGGGERASIILGRPFLCTTKAIIYEEHATIIFSIKDKKEKFSFKERIMHSLHTLRCCTYLKSQQHQHLRKRTTKLEEEQAQPSARRNCQDDRCSQRRK